MKTLKLFAIATLLAGCGFKVVRTDRAAERAKDEHLRQIEMTIIEAVKNNEACATICVKLKELNAALLDRWYGKK